jgi:hypothetical protein
VGGKPADVLYAGGAIGIPHGGVQVNIRVPHDAPVGDQSIVIQIGEASSPFRDHTDSVTSPQRAAAALDVDRQSRSAEPRRGSVLRVIQETQRASATH